MCLVRAPLDESTEAHIVHFWGWRDPGFCWLGLLLPFVDFLTGTSSDEDDVWSTSLSWISSSASLSLKTTFSWRSSLSNRIWQDQSFDFEESEHQNCFTCRTVSAFASSTTECVIKCRDNSSHLYFSWWLSLSDDWLFKVIDPALSVRSSSRSPWSFWSLGPSWSSSW